MKSSTIQNRKKRIWTRLAGVVIWLAVWQIISLFVNQEIYIVSPVRVFIRIFEMMLTWRFWGVTLLSFLRIAAGLFLGIGAGILLAILTYQSQFLDHLFYPLLRVCRATPVTSFILLAFVWFREPYIPILVSFLIVLPVVWGNVLEGIRNTDVKLLEMARVMQIGKMKTLFQIYVPSVKPYFIAACTVSAGLAWKSGIAAEVIVHPARGIGTELFYSKIYLETKDLFAWTVIVILLSILCEKIFVKLMKGRNPYGSTRHRSE